VLRRLQSIEHAPARPIAVRAADERPPSRTASAGVGDVRLEGAGGGEAPEEPSLSLGKGGGCEGAAARLLGAIGRSRSARRSASGGGSGGLAEVDEEGEEEEGGGVAPRGAAQLPLPPHAPDAGAAPEEEPARRGALGGRLPSSGPHLSVQPSFLGRWDSVGAGPALEETQRAFAHGDLSKLHEGRAAGSGGGEGAQGGAG
jgi:hypothetical protein